MDTTTPEYQAAYAATNPDDSPEKRDASAQAILAGQAANAVYWASRGELEQLKAYAAGHGVVTRGDAEEPSTAVGGGTEAPAIEATATDVTDEPASPAAASSTPAAPSPTPDNPVEAVAKLRAQLANAGITPEA